MNQSQVACSGFVERVGGGFNRSSLNPVTGGNDRMSQIVSISTLQFISCFETTSTLRFTARMSRIHDAVRFMR